MILKLGSKGEDVKTLQRLLERTVGGVGEIDGVFGPKTDAAVRAFQSLKGLEVDGIVGNKTMAAFDASDITATVVKTNSKCVDESVIYEPLKYCITRTPNRAIKYLAIHYTAGASSAPGRAKTMKNGWEKSKRASADFGVDDTMMVQFNPDLRNYKCWSVGDRKNPYSGGGQLYGKATNANTISIEICSNLKKGFDASKVNHEGWYFTEATLNNAIKLTKILMKKFNIPIERVVRHYDVSGKICPGVKHWNLAPLYDANGKKTGKNNDESAWAAFKERLK